MSEEMIERRRVRSSMIRKKMDVAKDGKALVPSLKEGRMGSITAPLKKAAWFVHGLAYGEEPLMRLMFGLGNMEPTAFVDTMNEFYQAFTRPSELYVYIKRGNRDEAPFRGYMKIYERDNRVKMEPYRKDLVRESDELVDVALSTNRVYLVFGGKSYYVERHAQSLEVLTDQLDVEIPGGSALVAPFRTGVLRAFGRDLTFGGIASPAKRTLMATAAFTVHLEDHLSARIDGLTGLSNRMEYNKSLRYAIEIYLHCKIDTSIAMMDLDHFKRINDELGHDAGDAALVAASNKALDTFRLEDTVSRNTAGHMHSLVRDRSVFRYGGEELVVVLSGADALGGAKAAERFRQALEQSEILEDHPERKVTVSIGVASVSQAEWALRKGFLHALDAGASYESLDMGRKIEAIARILPLLADKALYVAKEDRNSVVMALQRADPENPIWYVRYTSNVPRDSLEKPQY